MLHITGSDGNIAILVKVTRQGDVLEYNNPLDGGLVLTLDDNGNLVVGGPKADQYILVKGWLFYIFTYIPEVPAFMARAGIPNDATLFNASTPQEITGEGLWSACDTLIAAWKSAFGLTLNVINLITRMPKLYLRIGGTSAFHRLNFTQTKFDGTFNGGWTHNGTGSLPNGTNAFFDCVDFLFNSPAQFDMQSVALLIDSKTNRLPTGAEIDAYGQDGARPDFFLYARDPSGNMVSRLDSDGTNKSDAITRSDGLLMLNRLGSTQYKAYREGVLLGTHATANPGTQPINLPMLFSGLTGSQYSFRKTTLTAVTNGGLSAIEEPLIRAAWRTFEGTLNRNVALV